MTTVRIGPGDSGQTIKLKTSDRLFIELPENPTTGFRWQLESTPGPLRLIRDTYRGPGGNGIGAASTRVFEFKAERRKGGKAERRKGGKAEHD